MLLPLRRCRPLCRMQTTLYDLRSERSPKIVASSCKSRYLYCQTNPVVFRKCLAKVSVLGVQATVDSRFNVYSFSCNKKDLIGSVHLNSYSDLRHPKYNVG